MTIKDKQLIRYSFYFLGLILFPVSLYVADNNKEYPIVSAFVFYIVIVFLIETICELWIEIDKLKQEVKKLKSLDSLTKINLN